jgi:hypothetical protein
MTNRRSFLFGMIAAAVLDPERLLWVPGAKTISIPSPPKLVESWIYFVRTADGEYRRITECEAIEVRFRALPALSLLSAQVERQVALNRDSKC